MGELVIQYHDFENAKKELKKFSEQTTTDLDLKRVDDAKGVGEFLGDWLFGRGVGLNHKVTGEELNDLTSQIQSHLHSVNNTQIKLIKEFGQVYSALEALDKDYIQAILISVKATEETSKSIQETQGQIKKIVENQRKTLEELKKFKQKLDGYDHLGDIDKIWSDYQKWYKEINKLSDTIGAADKNSQESVKKADAMKNALTAAEKKIDAISRQTGTLIKKLESVIVFTKALEQITHIKDIDEMWESLSSVHNAIQNIGGDFKSIQNEMAKHQKDINTLLSFMEKLLGLEYLMEVDGIYKQTEDHKLRIKELEAANGKNTAKLNELAQTDDRILERIGSIDGKINRLNKYQEKLSSFEHLDEVDSIWEGVEKHMSCLAELNKQNENFGIAIQKNKEDVEAKIAAAIQETNSVVESLTKKIKYAYLIAGGAVGLAVIELLLRLL